MEKGERIRSAEFLGRNNVANVMYSKQRELVVRKREWLENKKKHGQQNMMSLTFKRNKRMTATAKRNELVRK